jgi:hypothetical protein
VQLIGTVGGDALKIAETATTITLAELTHAHSGLEALFS